MYDIVARIIDHTWTNGDSMQQYVVYVCCALIIIFSVVVIDLVYRIFSHFWHS